MAEKYIPDRVWIRKSDAQLGYAITETIFGSPLFLFADHTEDEILTTRFCQFIADDGLTEDDFIDCGVL